MLICFIWTSCKSLCDLYKQSLLLYSSRTCWTCKRFKDSTMARVRDLRWAFRSCCFQEVMEKSTIHLLSPQTAGAAGLRWSFMFLTIKVLQRTDLPLHIMFTRNLLITSRLFLKSFSFLVQSPHSSKPLSQHFHLCMKFVFLPEPVMSEGVCLTLHWPHGGQVHPASHPITAGLAFSPPATLS